MTIKTKITPLGAGNKIYPKDFVVFESSTPGTYTFEIKKAQFEVTGSGAGGGTGDGAYANNGAGGTITVSSKLKIISTKIKTNGKAQSTVSILGNGFGAGGNIRAGTSGLSGTAGYIKIQFVK